MSDVLPIFERYTPLITAVFGGIGVKVLDKVMSKRSEAFNESAKIREELRMQINELREEVETKREEADDWRQKYWQQIEVNISQRGVIEDLRVQVDSALKVTGSSSTLSPE